MTTDKRRCACCHGKGVIPNWEKIHLQGGGHYWKPGPDRPCPECRLAKVFGTRRQQPRARGSKASTP
jgi:hypothetical protein